MKQQTAVEWLFLMLNNPNRDQDFANKLFEQAKEMEKQQIEKAYKDCHDLGNIYGLDTEKYYNETYNK